MGEEFLVQTSYPGYVFVGWAAGRFENKEKCLSPDVWKDLEIGSRVRLFFDDKRCVILAEPDE